MSISKSYRLLDDTFFLRSPSFLMAVLAHSCWRNVERVIPTEAAMGIRIKARYIIVTIAFNRDPYIGFIERIDSSVDEAVASAYIVNVLVQ